MDDDSRSLVPLQEMARKLRRKVKGLHEEWELLGATLEAERHRLSIAEDALALLQQKEAPSDGRAGGETGVLAAGAEGDTKSEEAMGEGLPRAQASEGRRCALVIRRVNLVPRPLRLLLASAPVFQSPFGVMGSICVSAWRHRCR
jgi:hypothetical protein